jgi:hypothetical protein
MKHRQISPIKRYIDWYLFKHLFVCMLMVLIIEGLARVLFTLSRRAGYTGILPYERVAYLLPFTLLVMFSILYIFIRLGSSLMSIMLQIFKSKRKY